MATELKVKYNRIKIFQSPRGKLDSVPKIDLIKQTPFIISNFDFILSIHCKQIFPPCLFKEITCVNVHPGYNPYNKGWYPHIFSMINGLPSGVTIHEITEEIDNGPIIYQKEYKIKSWDTSTSVYENIKKIERNLLFKYFTNLRDKKYKTYSPKTYGNYNKKQSFDKLVKINLDKCASFREFINILRALSHKNYKNAYFIDENKNKVFIDISLKKE